MTFDASTLFLSLVISSVGLVLMNYGRKEARVPFIAAGLALVVYPYFTSSFIATLLVGAGIVAALWLAVRSGW